MKPLLLTKSDPPPTYKETAGFTVQKSVDENGLPTVEATLAHLGLLEALYALKDEVAYTDGLFDIWDCRAHGTEESAAASQDIARKRLESLAAIREKRWTLYVARAVRRYEFWWTDVLKVMDKERAIDATSGRGLLSPLTTRKMAGDYAWFDQFTSPQKYDLGITNPTVWEWTPDMLPPLDIIMVWHTHMLNPRKYLEDCLRSGYRETWHAGMPWKAINSCIDDNFQYHLPSQAQERWDHSTFRPWDNIFEKPTRDTRCPKCMKVAHLPWTTTSRPPHDTTAWDMEDSGAGYGEPGLSYDCLNCKQNINHDSLRLGRFKLDARFLLAEDTPLKGTIVPGAKGLPSRKKSITGNSPISSPTNSSKAPCARACSLCVQPATTICLSAAKAA